MKTKTKDLTVMGLFIALMLAMAFIPNVGMITLGTVSISITHLPVVIGTILLGWKKGFILSLAFGLISMLRSFTPAGAADILFQNPLISVLPRLFIGFGTYGVYVAFRALFNKLSAYMQKSSENTVNRLSYIIAATMNILIFVIIYFSLTNIVKLSAMYSGLIAGIIGAFAGIAINNALRTRIKKPEKSAVSFACAAGAFTNTVFVLLAFYFFVPIFYSNVLVANNLVDTFIPYLLGLAGTNGIVEAVFFSVVGTPITLALMKYMKKGNSNDVING